MAQPKRRWSKERTALKRSTWKLEEKNFATCSHCGETIMPHRACPKCGYYNNKPAVEVAKETK